MNNLIYDIKHTFAEHRRKSPLTLHEKFGFIFSNGIKALMAYRLRRYINDLNINGIWLPAKWLLLAIADSLCFAARILFGIHIHPQAEIGGGLHIGHFGGVFIGRCKIGKNCALAHQVKIGEADNTSGAGPQIGHNVWIGAHSKIVGNIVIEDHATIASGAVVTSDVRKNTLVMGNPARAVYNNYDNAYLL